MKHCFPFLRSTSNRSESLESSESGSVKVIWFEDSWIRGTELYYASIEMYLSFSDLKRSVAVVVASILDHEDPSALEQPEEHLLQ